MSQAVTLVEDNALVHNGGAIPNNMDLSSDYQLLRTPESQGAGRYSATVPSPSAPV
ncbi:MAG: hypothetical protein KGN32_05810 [Burkholderiales bacterium]|nr:hypothetical protein [Burkholderiales bacterium]